MTYFRELPNIEYPNFLNSRTGSQDYITMKNIFLRSRLRKDLQAIYVFDKYTIRGDDRADTIADELYGSSTYDWVVLISANLINYQNDFPLSSQELFNYTQTKYGAENIYDIHHYVSTEVKDELGRLIYPKDVVVAQDFTIPNPDFPTSTISPVAGVSNIEYETARNDEKRNISVLRRSYLNQFIIDMRQISAYGFNSEYVNSFTIRASNNKTKSP
jgi:hypothetical protein